MPVGNSLFPSSSANSVFVSGNEVFVGGGEYDGITIVPKIWKDGQVSETLTNVAGDAFVSSVFVLGGDVYAAGYENIGSGTAAKGWKNGTEFFSSLQLYSSFATSVFVVN